MSVEQHKYNEVLETIENEIGKYGELPILTGDDSYQSARRKMEQVFEGLVDQSDNLSQVDSGTLGYQDKIGEGLIFSNYEVEVEHETGIENVQITVYSDRQDQNLLVTEPHNRYPVSRDLDRAVEEDGFIVDLLDGESTTKEETAPV